MDEVMEDDANDIDEEAESTPAEEVQKRERKPTAVPVCRAILRAQLVFLIGCIVIPVARIMPTDLEDMVFPHRILKPLWPREPPATWNM